MKHKGGPGAGWRFLLWGALGVFGWGFYFLVLSFPLLKSIMAWWALKKSVPIIPARGCPLRIRLKNPCKSAARQGHCRPRMVHTTGRVSSWPDGVNTGLCTPCEIIPILFMVFSSTTVTALPVSIIRPCGPRALQ